MNGGASRGRSPVRARRASSRRWRGDRGSALLLLPAAFLVVVLLAALAADGAVVHLARRELLQAAGAAANDAATASLDEAGLRHGGVLVVSPPRARAAVTASLAAGDLADTLAAAPKVEVAADGAVTVELVQDVDHLFGPALPHTEPSTRITARATAARHAR